MELLVTYGWVVWITVMLICFVVEAFVLDGTSLMFALASGVGLASSFTPLPFLGQVILVCVTAVALLFLLRPKVIAALSKKQDPARSNIDALIGMHGKVLSLRPEGAVVQLSNGETWTARGTNEAAAFSVDQPVQVLSVEGARVVVQPL